MNSAAPEIATLDPDLFEVLKTCPDDRKEALLKVAARNDPRLAELLGLAPEPPAAAELEGSETANARKFAAMYGQDFRFIAERQAWHVWTGRSWEPDSENLALAKTGELAETLRAEALAIPANDDAARARQEARLKWANRSFAERCRANCLTLAAVESGIPARLETFDAKPWLFNVQNGTLDLQSGTLREHDRRDLLTVCAEVTFDPAATCPRWRQFLDEIFENDAELIEFMRRAVGYTLSGDISEQCLFILYGSGANGKSVFLETLRRIWGPLARHSSIETFTRRDAGKIPEDRARLRGARLATVSESARNQFLDESFIKDSCGGEPITARRLHENSFEFNPTFKLWLATNHKPTISGTDEGIWRRLRLIPFRRFFTPAERDPALLDRLQSEAAGILAWAVAGCLEWQKNGLGMPAVVEAATADYRSESDVLGQFFGDCCAIDPALTITAARLYENYAAWATDNGFKPTSSRSLGLALKERSFEAARDHSGRRAWKGIGILTH